MDAVDKIKQLVTSQLQGEVVKIVPASDYGLQPADQPVLRSVLLEHPQLGRVKLVESTELARSAPEPFEWQIEITYLDIDEPYRHYLLLNDGKFVRANRKDFLTVDEKELTQLLSELGELSPSK